MFQILPQGALCRDDTLPRTAADPEGDSGIFYCDGVRVGEHPMLGRDLRRTALSPANFS